MDDWFARYNKRIRKNIAPDTGYNAVPISIGATFEAVTRALRASSRPINEEGGWAMLSIWWRRWRRHGKIPRARGDLQFRIYVVLNLTHSSL